MSEATSGPREPEDQAPEEALAPAPTGPRVIDPESVLSVHLGRSANCSSIGSFIDFLFLSSVAGASVVSVIAALASEAASDGSTDRGAPDEPARTVDDRADERADAARARVEPEGDGVER